MVQQKEAGKKPPRKRKQLTVQFNINVNRGRKVTGTERKTGRLVARNSHTVWVEIKHVIFGREIIRRHIEKHRVTAEGGGAL
jgi:hypothetical protein